MRINVSQLHTTSLPPLRCHHSLCLPHSHLHTEVIIHCLTGLDVPQQALLHHANSDYELPLCHASTAHMEVHTVTAGRIVYFMLHYCTIQL